jgi:hypothetical protein
MIEGSGARAGSVPDTNGSGSGGSKTRIRNTGLKVWSIKVAFPFHFLDVIKIWLFSADRGSPEELPGVDCRGHPEHLREQDLSDGALPQALHS